MTDHIEEIKEKITELEDQMLDKDESSPELKLMRWRWDQLHTQLYGLMERDREASRDHLS